MKSPTESPTPKEAEPLVLLLAPLTPHIAENTEQTRSWSLGSLLQSFLSLMDKQIEIPIQINSKVKK